MCRAMFLIGTLSGYLIVNACASLTAYPERSYDPKAELEAMKMYLSQEAITKYYADDDKQRNGMSKRQWRNAVVNARIHANDLHFNDFQQGLFREGVGFGIATDWVVLALSGAGALFSTASTALSAAATGVVGAKASFDKNAFFDMTMPALLATMVAKRKEVLVRIRNGLSKDIEKYPLELALSDLDSYYNAGSVPGALMEVAETAGQTADQADTQLRQMLVVMPVPPELQARREQAAAFVKTLDDNQLKTLAKSLNRSTKGDVLVTILDEIAAAQTFESFDIIAQKIKILFNKEV